MNVTDTYLAHVAGLSPEDRARFNDYFIGWLTALADDSAVLKAIDAAEAYLLTLNAPLPSTRAAS